MKLPIPSSIGTVSLFLFYVSNLYWSIAWNRPVLDSRLGSQRYGSATEHNEVPDATELRTSRCFCFPSFHARGGWNTAREFRNENWNEIIGGIEASLDERLALNYQRSCLGTLLCPVAPLRRLQSEDQFWCSDLGHKLLSSSRSGWLTTGCRRAKPY